MERDPCFSWDPLETCQGSFLVCKHEASTTRATFLFLLVEENKFGEFFFLNVTFLRSIASCSCRTKITLRTFVCNFTISWNFQHLQLLWSPLSVGVLCIYTLLRVFTPDTSYSLRLRLTQREPMAKVHILQPFPQDTTWAAQNSHWDLKPKLNPSPGYPNKNKFCTHLPSQLCILSFYSWHLVLISFSFFHTLVFSTCSTGL